MTEFECYKCKKTFVKKDNFNKHINRKYSCIPMDDSVTKLSKDMNIKFNLQEQQIKELQEQIKQLLKI